MRCTGKLLTYVMFAVVAMLVSQTQAQDLAPAPPMIDGDVAVQQDLVPAEPLPLASVNELSCDGVSNCCDSYQPGATCCCVEPYRCPCCGHIDCYAPGIHKRKRNGKMIWCRYWTTGDMYQHYAYYPQYHGSYYFRPYNYTNVLEHQETIVCLGGDRSQPYSVAMFDSIYETYYELNPVITPVVLDRETIPGASQLPVLEDLLSE